MAILTGDEPWHWHDAVGNHRMLDPRTVPGLSRTVWTTEERKYVAHLEQHAIDESSPGRRDNDTPAVSALFDMIDNSEATADKARKLIALLRKAETGGRE